MICFYCTGCFKPIACEFGELLFLAYQNGFQNHSSHLITNVGGLPWHIKCIVTLSPSLKNFSKKTNFEISYSLCPLFFSPQLLSTKRIHLTMYSFLSTKTNFIFSPHDQNKSSERIFIKCWKTAPVIF